jgi:hypothetical protein
VFGVRAAVTPARKRGLVTHALLSRAEAHSTMSRVRGGKVERADEPNRSRPSMSALRMPNVSGGYIEKAIPDPIPNSEVKLLGADGTAWATVWESRTLPG